MVGGAVGGVRTRIDYLDDSLAAAADGAFVGSSVVAHAACADAGMDRVFPMIRVIKVG